MELVCQKADWSILEPLLRKSYVLPAGTSSGTSPEDAGTSSEDALGTSSSGTSPKDALGTSSSGTSSEEIRTSPEDASVSASSGTSSSDALSYRVSCRLTGKWRPLRRKRQVWRSG